MGLTVKLITLGCKLNKYESDCMASLLMSSGYTITDEILADIYVINTCAVTSESEKKSRQYVSKCLSYNPSAKIIVCGCASQNNMAQFADKNVYSIIGVDGKEKIVSLIDNLTRQIYDLPTTYTNIENPYVTTTRSYLKVQDGCNNFCSYCLIPYLRGRSRSRDIGDCVNEAINLAKISKEIVVTGIDLSSYKPSLNELMKSLSLVNARIRLGSLEVNVISDELLKTLKSMKNFCPQFHLSLQSGCDTVLKRMNRHYSSAEYFEKVKLIRSYFPNANITTDVIVGFGYETEEEFNITKEFVKQVNFGQVHIFPYSKREGTVATKLYKDLPLATKKKRVDDLEVIARKSKLDYINSLCGQQFTVLTEDTEGDFVVGYTENYIKIYLPKDTEKNKLILIKIGEPFLDGAKGVL